MKVIQNGNLICDNCELQTGCEYPELLRKRFEEFKKLCDEKGENGEFPDDCLYYEETKEE